MTEFTPQPNENILAEGMVSFGPAVVISPIAGKLIITDQRLVFNKQGLNLSKKEVDLDIPLSNIRSYGKSWMSIGLSIPLPTALKVDTADGKSYRFHCGLERAKYLEALKTALKR